MRTLATVLGALTLASLGGLGDVGRAAPSGVVPLRVQRVLQTHAPRVAYVPTRLPPGFRYDHYENLGRWGYDLYFTTPAATWIGFDALLVKPGEPCNQGSATKRFRVDGVLVLWNAGHNDQQAWRCIRRGGTRVLLTATTSSDWRPPKLLARMVASARPIK
jgi:hypothetical protein